MQEFHQSETMVTKQTDAAPSDCIDSGGVTGRRQLAISVTGGIWQSRPVGHSLAVETNESCMTVYMHVAL